MGKKLAIKYDFRHETKFVVSDLGYHEIENLIKHHPIIFSEEFHERKINNIYFDSMDLKNYHDNLSGNAQRIKIRIRWYENLFGEVENPILELKIKEGSLGRKEYFKLKPFNFNRDFNMDDFRKNILNKSNLPKEIIEILKSSKPTLLNSYTRKYFISSDKKARITLDKNLFFFKINNHNNHFNEKIIEKDFNVVELKYSQENSEAMQELTQHFPFRSTANSKYVYRVNVLDQ